MVMLDWSGVALWSAAWFNGEALKSAQEALRLSPSSPECMDALATSLLHLRRYPEAEALARKLIARDPEGARPNYLLGYACYKQKNWAEAEASYLRYLEIQTHDGHVHEQVMHCLMRQKKWKEAGRALLKSMRLPKAYPWR